MTSFRQQDELPSLFHAPPSAGPRFMGVELGSDDQLGLSSL